MMISTTNGTEWSPVNSDSDSENTPPTSPRFLRNNNDNNAHFSSSDDYTSSSDLSPRASPRKVVKQSGPSRWSRFTALFNREEKQVISDQRSAIQINAAFGAFLNKKAQDGGKFSLRERFNYNCIEYIDAKGVAKFKAFIKIGGFGAIAARKFTEEQKTDLRKQFEFHRALSLATDCFNRFANPSILSRSPTRADFERAKTAFENVLNTRVQNDRTEHGPINQIMNSVTGKQVANTLVEADAHYQLKDGGKVTQDSILTTFNSKSFLDKMEDFQIKGYRVATTPDEQKALQVFYSSTNEQGTLKQLLQAEEYRPSFYMVMTRAYNKLFIDDAMEHSHEGALESLESATLDAQVQETIRSQNDKLFELIKARDVPKETPVGIDSVAFKEMRDLYKNYEQARLTHLRISNEQVGSSTTLEEAKKHLAEFNVAEEKFTMEQLQELFSHAGDADKDGFDVFNAHKAKFEQKHQALTEKKAQATHVDGQIQARMVELQTELKKLKEESSQNDRGIADTQRHLGEVDLQIKDQKKVINSLEVKQDQLIGQSFLDDQTTLVRLGLEHDEHLKALGELVTNKQRMDQSIQLQERELVSLADDRTHDLWDTFNTLEREIAEHERYVQFISRTDLIRLSPQVENQRIGEININHALLENMVGIYNARFQQIAGESETSQHLLTQRAEALKAKGFVIENDQVTDFVYAHYESEEHYALVESEIEAQNKATNLFISATRFIAPHLDVKERNKTRALQSALAVTQPKETKPVVKQQGEEVVWDDGVDGFV